MSVTLPDPIARTTEAIVNAQLEERRRATAERRRRHLLRLIDLAMDGCELAMLAEQAETPVLAVALIAWLRWDASEAPAPPRTSLDAHEELLRLQGPFLRTLPDPDDGKERLCACGCGRQVEQAATGRPREYATRECWERTYRSFEQPVDLEAVGG
jgi:hypothetical protein